MKVCSCFMNHKAHSSCWLAYSETFLYLKATLGYIDPGDTITQDATLHAR